MHLLESEESIYEFTFDRSTDDRDNFIDDKVVGAIDDSLSKTHPTVEVTNRVVRGLVVNL